MLVFMCLQEYSSAVNLFEKKNKNCSEAAEYLQRPAFSAEDMLLYTWLF